MRKTFVNEYQQVCWENFKKTGRIEFMQGFLDEENYAKSKQKEEELSR